MPGFGHALQERHAATEGSLGKRKQSIQRPGRMSIHKKELAFRTEKQSLKGRMVTDCEGVAQKKKRAWIVLDICEGQNTVENGLKPQKRR